MNISNIREKCAINTNYEKDTFVGIKCEDGDISIHFPLGYEISKEEKELRKDIILLMNVLAANIDRKDSEILSTSRNFDEVQFPIQSYMAIISDYFERGYFKEQEIQYTVSKRGKINWNRTLKTQKPYIQDGCFYYLNLVTKRSTPNENELITLIHEYCVYESFLKMGWIFTKSMPQKPRIKYQQKLFTSVIKDKLFHTFNDKNKILFKNMLAIIKCQGDLSTLMNYKYGTYRFEYVWEKMIDKVFGIENKADYFPKTMWKVNETIYNNASLEPDTIMIYANDIYVLDAKYYKYGSTAKISDLPESTSINKQITYGEYIYKETTFRKKFGNEMKVYNAFLMPFNSLNGKYKCDKNMLSVGEAISSWKSNDKKYQRVVGVLLDVKHLMSINVRQEMVEISNLAAIIDNALMTKKDE